MIFPRFSIFIFYFFIFLFLLFLPLFPLKLLLKEQLKLSSATKVKANVRQGLVGPGTFLTGELGPGNMTISTALSNSQDVPSGFLRLPNRFCISDSSANPFFYKNKNENENEHEHEHENENENENENA